LLSDFPICFSSIFSILQDYVPKLFEKYIATVEVDGKSRELNLWDTAESKDYDRLRPMGYRRVDINLICFAVDSPDSLENAEKKVRQGWSTPVDGSLLVYY